MMPAAGRPVVVSRTWQVMGSLDAIVRWEVSVWSRSALDEGSWGIKNPRCCEDVSKALAGTLRIWTNLRRYCALGRAWEEGKLGIGELYVLVGDGKRKSGLF